MALTKQQWIKEPSGAVRRFDTYTAFDEPTPSENCRTYDKTLIDGVWTLVEEYYENTGKTQARVECTLMTEPIESAKYFDDVDAGEMKKWKLWVQNPQDPTLGTWTPQTSTAPKISNQLFALWKLGERTYLVPRIVARYTNVATSPPTAVNIGKISTADVPVAHDGNAIYSGMSAQQEGNLWRFELEYMASGERPFNTFVYGTST